MKPPLDLAAEVTTSDGTRYRWDANQAPGSRLRGFSFSTKVGEGFSNAQGSLARRIDLDYPDLDLVNTVTLVGADGSVAYEGRVEAMPRELGDAHSVGVTLAGWMAHAKDRKFTEIYVDRDLGAWGPPSRGRRITLLGLNYNVNDPSQSVDPGDATAGVDTTWDSAWASPFLPTSEAWYDAGPTSTVAKVAYYFKYPTGQAGPTGFWQWNVFIAADDKATTATGTANLIAASPGSGVFNPGVNYRYAMVRALYSSTPGGADGGHYGINWYQLAAYGPHNLMLRPGEAGQPDGVIASDVIRNIVTRWCPELNPAGVIDTTYVIQHLTFKDRTFPYDAFLEINKFHLWHLGVWEDRTLHFRPYDLTDYDWEIRTDDPGTTFAPQGQATDDLFNGIVVKYTDLTTQTVNVLTPETQPTLLDSSDENPWNRFGISHWDEIELSTPTVAAQALQIGRMALAERNRPKTPGTITVKGHVRDRAGNHQPAWKVRAGDTISVTNFPNDSPRLIVETAYDDDNKTVTLSIDRPFALVDAYMDRVSNAIGARGLT